MKLVGLGGGIGAGKSTVSERLAVRGAVIIDADVIAREVVAPGGIAYGSLIERFGVEILLADGTLDRPALAKIVFSDVESLAALNAITHPAITQTIQERVEPFLDTERILFLDAALLFDTPKAGLVGKMVVDVDPEIAVQRLMTYRGFSEEDARARLRAQMSREERLAMADFVIDNSGPTDALDAEVERAWKWIETLPASREQFCQG